jgi:hypothetical protein
MAAPPGLFDGLVDDAAMFPPGNAPAETAVSEHRHHRSSWFAPVIGPLVVSDQRLAEVGRIAARTEGPELAVSVVNTTGAGGLLSLAQREVPGLRVVSVESALRDLDDLAGNAARVVSAAAELGEEVAVFVEIPYAAGWERAVAEVEAAGLSGKLRTGGPDARDCPTTDQLARQLSVLVEADLPFKLTAGLHHALPVSGDQAGPGPGDPPGQLRQHGFLCVMLAVAGLVDGATEAEAGERLSRTDRDAVAAELAGWDAGQVRRVRRRLRSFGCCGVLDPVNDLVALGLLGESE